MSNDATVRMPHHASLALGALIVMGYGLFRSANSSIYLSHFSQTDGSFIFMTDATFNMASAFATAVCALAIVALSSFKNLSRFSMPLWPATAVLIVGMLLATTNLGELVPQQWALGLSVVVFSIGSIVMKLSWIEIFALESPTKAIIHIGCASLASSALQYALSPANGFITPVLTIAFLIGSAFCLQETRRRLRSDESFEPIPARPCAEARRKAMNEIGDALLTLCALESVIGLINSFMLAASMEFAGAALVPGMAMTIASVLFCVALLIARRIPAASAMFRIAFPILAAMVVFVPFMSEGYSRLFSTMLLVSYDFVALLVVYQVAYAANRFGVSSYALFALTTGCAKFSLFVSLVVGGTFGEPHIEQASSTVRFLVLSCGIIYLLAMAIVLLSRDRKRHGNKKSAPEAEAPLAPFKQASKADEVADETASCAREEVSTDGGAPCAREEAFPGSAQALSSTNESNESETDAFEGMCRLLAAQYGLTERETEVLGYLARGRTNTYIAEELSISPTTVRGHIRHIYTKLDVHKRQELIDLFN